MLSPSHSLIVHFSARAHTLIRTRCSHLSSSTTISRKMMRSWANTSRSCGRRDEARQDRRATHLWARHSRPPNRYGQNAALGSTPRTIPLGHLGGVTPALWKPEDHFNKHPTLFFSSVCQEGLRFIWSPDEKRREGRQHQKRFYVLRQLFLNEDARGSSAGWMEKVPAGEKQARRLDSLPMGVLMGPSRWLACTQLVPPQK